MEFNLFRNNPEARYAVISDIHSNHAALKAVFDDISSVNTDGIICLGDIVGYGPDPDICTRMIKEKTIFSVMGNHDYIVLFFPAGVNPVAKKAAEWTKKKMLPRFYNFPFKMANWKYLKNLPKEAVSGDWMFVHGSPRDSLSEYIHMEKAEYGECLDSLKDIFTMFSKVCFVGHTHIPGILDSYMIYHKPADIDMKYTFEDDNKVIVNVGSVGFPRDKDPRPCYAIVDAQGVEFRRVEYKIKETAKKIAKIPSLDDRLIERLKTGK